MVYCYISTEHFRGVVLLLPRWRLLLLLLLLLFPLLLMLLLLLPLLLLLLLLLCSLGILSLETLPLIQNRL